jgi:hypothetical protein
VSVISHHWCYITFPNDYVTDYIPCYITSFATCAFQSSALSSSAGSRSSQRSFSVAAARRRASLVRSLRLCSASATVTCRGWPLPYRHIQRLSSYILPLPLPALVSATAPLRRCRQIDEAGMVCACYISCNVTSYYMLCSICVTCYLTWNITCFVAYVLHILSTAATHLMQHISYNITCYVTCYVSRILYNMLHNIVYTMLCCIICNTYLYCLVHCHSMYCLVHCRPLYRSM